MIFITAFLTGLLGSFHCAGMCGPIALAVPTFGNSQSEKILSKLLYNAGRVLTYTILGAILGAFGTGLKLAGLQQSVSIVAGSIIILSVIFSRIKKVNFSVQFFSTKLFGKLFKQRNVISTLGIGLLNGLLPCGFVYIALIASVATQDIFTGMTFMFFFGLGTIPMMFTVSMIGQFLTSKVRSNINKLIPVFAIVIGCLFILRGLNLGIPYVSPQLSNDQQTVKECCKP